MMTDNLKRINFIKRFYYLTAGIMAVAAVVFILLDQPITALIFGCVFVIWFFVFQSADFEYVQYGIEEGRFIMRYFPAAKFGRKDYNTIEFPVNLLHDYKFEKSLFGLVWDITLLVKTKRGVAGYPSVSLAALTKAEKDNLEQVLQGILKR